MDGDGRIYAYIQVLNNGTKQVEDITLEKVEDILGTSSDVHPTDLDRLDMLLFVKDSYGVSNTACHEMAQLCKTLQDQGTNKRT